MSESQQKMILDILLTGQRITVLQLSTKPVYSMYGGKRISELKVAWTQVLSQRKEACLLDVNIDSKGLLTHSSK